MKLSAFACFVLALVFVGCSGTNSSATSTTPVEPAVPAGPGPGAVPAGEQPPDDAGASAPDTERVKAEVGVAQKGKSLEEHSGVIVEPLKAYIRVEQKAVFEIQIPQAMQLFEATEGRKPNSHDEFMSKIIGMNNIKLPKLPEGHRYVYNPESGELQVERPAK